MIVGVVIEERMEDRSNHYGVEYYTDRDDDADDDGGGGSGDEDMMMMTMMVVVVMLVVVMMMNIMDCLALYDRIPVLKELVFFMCAV